MKAVEYAKQYMDASDKQAALATILTDFIRDIGRIGEARHITKPVAMVALLREQENKLHKFCELVNVKLKPDALRIIMKDQHPEVWSKIAEVAEGQTQRL